MASLLRFIVHICILSHDKMSILCQYIHRLHLIRYDSVEVQSSRLRQSGGRSGGGERELGVCVNSISTDQFFPTRLPAHL